LRTLTLGYYDRNDGTHLCEKNDDDNRIATTTATAYVYDNNHNAMHTAAAAAAAAMNADALPLSRRIPS